MAEIVLGLAASHSPLLTIDWSEWQHRAQADLANEQLNLSDGRFVSYAQLRAERGDAYAAIATPQAFEAAAVRCQAGLDRLADALAAAAPDVVMVIGDDQGELFPLSNTPAISVYYGAEIATNDVWGRDDKPAWMHQMAKGYAMDRVHRFPGAPELARDVIAGLIRRHVDIGAASKVDDPVKAGFGHAFGFVAERLFRERAIPMLPVLLNTYFPPNVMMASRAFDIGRLLRAAIEESPSDARVAVVASGGLSHFVVDEELDRQVLAGLEPGRDALLRSIPPEALNSGSSEILNWVMSAGAADHLPLSWTEYEPIRRTPAGTGIGVGFAAWGA
ncbi:hypothetical protein [Niveispirillum sp.]|uniref:DODA-type extradiol aromatic ring-opening family dioxygenase n=1 Tax=Niveispirillum sp. TaxID=1917217 RepID=UPI001B45542C|nr:hypothetical protein [Niveispirillum sp.]MBP7339142.1 hypothetical protein [Niveispirillum sp.]